MEWFEPLIIIAAVGFVITVFYFHFFHKKKGHKCGSGCCSCCSTKSLCKSCSDLKALIKSKD